MACHACRDHEPRDHHHPDDRCRGSTPARFNALRQQHEQRCPRGADPEANQQKAAHCECDAARGADRHRGRRDGREDASRCEHGHATDDPGRASTTDVRAVAEAGTQHLDHVVQRYQHARQHGRERELDHHDPIHRRGRQHDDRPERRLHEPQPQDADPAEPGRDARHHSIALRSANALTIIPVT